MIQLAASFSRHLPHLREPRPDGELLAAFLAERDEDAFAELVRRHGPLVWAACRRTLPDATDAEDAFQASFLVLVRRARRLKSRDTIGPWLYQVAVWTARNIRRRNARMLSKREPLGDTPAAGASPDLRNDLDDALAALPEKYRTPLVLCHLQGWSRREAAARLGCPEGTLSSLLSRGLERLRTKLAGLDPAKALAMAAPAVPMLLANSTVKAAAGMHLAASATVHQLVEGVVRMFWIKKATAASFALVAIFGMGMGVGVSVQQVPGAAAGDGPIAVGVGSDDVELLKAEEAVAQIERFLADAAKEGDAEKVAAAKAKLDEMKRVLEQARRAQADRERAAERLTRVRERRAQADEFEKLKKSADMLQERRAMLEAKLKTAKEKLAAAPQAPDRNDTLKQIEKLEAEHKAVQAEEIVVRIDLEVLALSLKEERTPAQRELEAQIEKLKAEQAQLSAEAEKLALMREMKQRELALLEAKRTADAKNAKVPPATVSTSGTLEISIGTATTQVPFKITEIGANGKPLGTASFDMQEILAKFIARAGLDPKGPRAVKLSIHPGVKFETVLQVVEACSAAGLKSPSIFELKTEIIEAEKQYRRVRELYEKGLVKPPAAK